MGLYIDKKHHIKKINNYEELEVFIDEINTRDIELVNVLKDEDGYVVIYRSFSEVVYEIR